MSGLFMGRGSACNWCDGVGSSASSSVSASQSFSSDSVRGSSSSSFVLDTANCWCVFPKVWKLTIPTIPADASLPCCNVQSGVWYLHWNGCNATSSIWSTRGVPRLGNRLANPCTRDASDELFTFLFFRNADDSVRTLRLSERHLTGSSNIINNVTGTQTDFPCLGPFQVDVFGVINSCNGGAAYGKAVFEASNQTWIP